MKQQVTFDCDLVLVLVRTPDTDFGVSKRSLELVEIIKNIVVAPEGERANLADAPEQGGVS